MLMNQSGPIERGKPFKATLMFAKAGRVDVEFAVGPIGTKNRWACQRVFRGLGCSSPT
jgi:copper(I)-binding protein